MPIVSTGYYCVRLVNPNLLEISVAVDFVNTFGRLPAECYYSMQLTFLLLIAYGILAGLWIYLCIRHADELLTLQV
jgi:hypothetical protein